MDIKLKNIISSMWVRMISAILAVVFLSTAFINLGINYVAVRDKGFSFSSVENEEYLDSYDFFSKVDGIASDLNQLVHFYKSEEHIRNGGTIDDEVLMDIKIQVYQNERYRQVYQNARYRNEYGYMDEDILRDIDINSKEFEKQFATQIENLRQNRTSDDLREFNAILTRLDEMKNNDGLNWVAQSKEVKFSSKEELQLETIKNDSYYYVDEQGKIDSNIVENTAVYYYYGIGNAIDKRYPNLDTTIAFAFDQSAIMAERQTYALVHQQTVRTFQMVIICAGVALLFGVIALIGTGRRPHKAGTTLSMVDRVPIDLHTLIIGIVLPLLIALTIYLVDSRSDNRLLERFAITVGVALGVNYTLSFARQIKSKTLKNNFLTLNILKYCGRILMNFYNQFFAHRSMVMLASGMFLMAMIAGIIMPVGLLVIIPLIILVIYEIRNLDAITKGVEIIKNEDSHYVIDSVGRGKFADLAENINNINAKMRENVADAVKKELKSERLKTELITNVSHDIRTPLTSIITYIDLIKKENISAEEHAQYLEILEAKADRLKVLIDDLFEAAKASSGNIEMQLEKVGFVAIANQALAEFEEKIGEKGLNFVLDYPNQELMINADGKLLWRIIENLLSNVTKYALEGSRVYFEITEDGDEGVFIIKNISSSPLNISEDELIERFKRGDETRHSEGSGLGLSIARDLTKLQGGVFDLKIDGDLFKVCLKFKKAI